MKSILAFGAALLPIAIGKVLLPRQANYTVTHFGLIAIHSTSPIHLSSVNAADNKFWIGRDTETYCPDLDVEGFSCSMFKNYTVLAQGSDSDTLGMYTNVPGGQGVYVAPNGALSYTIAHSGATPAGSHYESFTAEVPEEGRVGSLKYNGSDFLACPTHRKRGPYQVFVAGVTNKDVPGHRVKDCISFLAGAVRYTDEEPAAWQYD